MITKWIVDAFIATISSLFTIIPVPSLPTIEAPTTAIGYVNEFARVVPLSFLFICMVASLALTLVLYLWDLTVFIYHQFWGSD